MHYNVSAEHRHTIKTKVTAQPLNCDLLKKKILIFSLLSSQAWIWTDGKTAQAGGWEVWYCTVLMRWSGWGCLSTFQLLWAAQSHGDDLVSVSLLMCVCACALVSRCQTLRNLLQWENSENEVKVLTTEWRLKYLPMFEQSWELQWLFNWLKWLSGNDPGVQKWLRGPNFAITQMCLHNDFERCS